MSLTRRQFIQSGLLGISALGLSGSAFWLGENTSNFRIDEQTCAFENLPKSFIDYRIGVIADIHHGAYFQFDWLEQVKVLLNAAKLDLLLLCGDYIWVHDKSIEVFFPNLRNPRFARKRSEEKVLAGLILQELLPFLKEIKVKDGCFAVLGNHDRWISAALCTSALESAGIEVLSNKFKLVKRGQEQLTLIGLDDYWTGIPEVPADLPAISSKNFRLAFTHNPDLLSSLKRNNSLDFQLGVAGHTHGGQIKLAGLPAPYYNIWDRRLGEGLFEFADSCRIYTTRGLGVVEIPYRIGCAPEVSVLTLRIV